MSNLGMRILSAAVLLPAVLAIVLLAPPFAFVGLVLLVAFLAGLEWSVMALPRDLGARRIAGALLAAFVSAAVMLSPWVAWAFPAALALVVPLSAACFTGAGDGILSGVNATVRSASGALYVGSLSGIVGLVQIANDKGRFWTLLLLAGAFLGDTLAYAAGRALGRHKLAPRVSPGKTWEGAIGGLVATCAAVALAKATVLPDLAWIDTLLLGVPLSVACQAGDLLESFFKRGFGVKDSGRLIPGHGGVLDRCDALLLGAPVVYLFVLLR